MIFVLRLRCVTHNQWILTKPLYSYGNLHLPPNTTESTHRLKGRGLTCRLNFKIFDYAYNTFRIVINYIVSIVKL